MDPKVFATVIVGALMALLTWNIKTTHELTLQVQKLEIILLDDAFSK